MNWNVGRGHNMSWDSMMHRNSMMSRDWIQDNLMVR